MEIPFQIAEILERLERAGYKAYVVGGCVRDSIMGITPHDYDVTTSALPKETERVFADCRVIETGLKHGTVTVLYKGTGVEITTFRVDGEYSDGRHPDHVAFADRVGDDLSRRDFTINGMAFNPREGLVDPFGGERDISARILRCIGDPDKRFSEDALRILRALRFASVLGFDIEKSTAESMLAHKGDLKRVSAERIFAELKRLLCGSGVKRVMLEFPEILSKIIPPLAEQVGYEQGSKYHSSTLYEHTARAVEAAPAEPAMRLAMLFHDCGKPLCRSVGEDGECHYYGHAELSARIADDSLRALKCDNAAREHVCQIVRFHDIPVELSRRYIRRQLSKHGMELFRDIMYAHIADDSAKADFARERIGNALRSLKIAEEIAAEQACFTLKDLAVSGRDLRAFVPQSPVMGRILSELLEEVVEDKIPNEKNALLQRAKKISEEIGNAEKGR